MAAENSAIRIEGDDRMGNPITWFEIVGPEPEQAATFYSELFGWHTQSVPESDYILIDAHSASGINGGFALTSEDRPGGTVFYAQGPDIQALLDKAGSLGARTVQPVHEVTDMATVALFTDPWGNLVGLLKGEESELGAVSGGSNPPVDWFELSCDEPQKAWEFYGELFGWQITSGEGEGFVHGGVDTGSGGAAGGIGTSPDGQPHVDMYALVDDLPKYLERSESLGGGTIMPPTDVGGGTSIALIVDPQGSTFGLYRHSHG
jgi:uncharacterized protein